MSSPLLEIATVTQHVTPPTPRFTTIITTIILTVTAVTAIIIILITATC